jgi:hypothetical protein
MITSTFCPQMQNQYQQATSKGDSACIYCIWRYVLSFQMDEELHTCGAAESTGCPQDHQ